jgi:hypothetical protein
MSTMTVLVSIVVMLSTIALLAFVLADSTAATASDRYPSFVTVSGSASAPTYDEPHTPLAELPNIAPADPAAAPPPEREPEPVLARGTPSTSTFTGRVAFSLTPVLQPKLDRACLRTPGRPSTAGARFTFVLTLGTRSGADGSSVRASGRQTTDIGPRTVRFTSTESAPARPRRLTTSSTSSATR